MHLAEAVADLEASRSAADRARSEWLAEKVNDVRASGISLDAKRRR
jgi:hypothetical protein